MPFLTATLHVTLSLAVAAQAPDQVGALTVPKFPIEPSALTLAGNVRPQQYVGADGSMNSVKV